MCKTCHKFFTTQCTLSKHRIWHHKDELADFRYNCNKCPYATNIWKSYKEHGFVHEENRPYQCTICGNGFKSLGSLNSHRLIHSGEEMLNFNF